MPAGLFRGRPGVLDNPSMVWPASVQTQRHLRQPRDRKIGKGRVAPSTLLVPGLAKLADPSVPQR